DVEEVDFLDAGENDRDAERLGEDDLAKRFAYRRGERLRIVEPLRQVVGIENDGGDADRSSERPAPDLIDPGDPSVPALERRPLEVEMGRRRRKRGHGLFLCLQRRSFKTESQFVHRQASAGPARAPRSEGGNGGGNGHDSRPRPQDRRSASLGAWNPTSFSNESFPFSLKSPAWP